MKRLWNCLLLISLLISTGSLAAPMAAAQGNSNPTSASSAIVLDEPLPPLEGGMPGWPLPEVPVPHHEPGRPSRAAGYTTQAIIQDEMGADVVVPLSGLDALLFDGVAQDPFQGNYRLVEENQVFAGLLNTGASTLGLQTVDIEDGALNPLDGTQDSISPVIQTDVTAGDLNGDGVDEQISAWFDDTGGDLKLSIGEMPVSSELPGETPPKVTAQPAAVAYTDGSMDLVARGYDGALWYKHYNGSSWGAWDNDAGGLLLSGPAIASRGAGQFDVFAYGFDPVDPIRAVMYTRHYESAAWTGSWAEVDASDPGLPISQSLPLPTLPAPAAVSRSSGQVDLFWLNEDNTLHWCEFNGSICVSEEDLGGMLASGPGVVSLDSNHMLVFARGVDDSLWYRAYDSGWGSWELLEMPANIAATSAPAVVSPASGQISVFVQGKDTSTEDALGALYYNNLAGGAWAGWQLIWEDDSPDPATVLGSGIAAAVAGGGTWVYAQMKDGSLGQAQFASGSLSTWDLDSLPASMDYVPSDSLPDGDWRSPLKVEAGHYWGAGRELYAVAYVTAARTISVSLFDIGGGGDGFTPNLLASILLNVDYTTADGQDDMDLAAGDLNGDGRDEIVIASIDRYRVGTHRLNVVDVSDCSDTGCTLTNRAGISGTTWIWSGLGVNEASTIHIATGDLDGDGDDEVVVGSTGNYLGDGNWADGLWALNELGDGSFGTLGSRFHGNCDYKFGEGSDAYPGPCTSGDLAVGNFIQEPGETVVEEIAFISPEIALIVFFPVPYYYRNFVVHVYQLNGTSIDEKGFVALDPLDELISGYYIPPTPVDQAAVVLSDLDADFLDEMVLARCYIGTCTSYLLEPGAFTFTHSVAIGSGNRAYLAAGDFIGESLRVGPPTFRIQEQMTTPIAFLNLPPMHRDIVWNESTEEYDVVELLNGASAEYSTGDVAEDASTTTSEREWDLSTGLETTVGAFGSSVTASLENTYGENFSNLQSTIASNSIQKTISADLHDQVVYNGTTYRIWEYPVLGIPEVDKAGPTTISVVYPFDFGDPLFTNPEFNKQYPLSCDENFYAPGHQTYNLWSYDAVASGDPGFQDFEELLVHDQTSGGSVLTLTIDTTSIEQRTSSFHNQFSAGVEYSYENSLDIPLIGKAWDISFRAYAKGSYGWEDVSTFGTTLNEVTEFSIDIPSSTGCSNTLHTYLYKAEGGYYVLDYQIEPDPFSACWSLYDKPDPAFTLNWYGFPDPGSPTPPPCGAGKKLFSHDVKAEPQYAEIGDGVAISATVRNFSPVSPAGDVTVRFYRGDPADMQLLGEDTLSGLNRATGSKIASITIPWIESYGVGEQKIYAVIDPDDVYDEVHEAGDLIDNNTAYGLLYVAGADHLDPGLQETLPYQSISLDFGDGLTVSAYLPTTNSQVTSLFELVPTPIEGIDIPGEPFRLEAYAGGESEPPASHDFQPAPAVLGIHAAGEDVSGLTLYRFNGASWVDATCAGYQTYRFPAENLLFVPVCSLTYSFGSETGMFALSDIAPDLAPEAEFSAMPLLGPAPLTVQFQDESLGNPTGWDWDFGDTSTHSSDQDPLHEYTNPGVYTVTLTVSNGFGSDVETKVAYITVFEEEKLYLPLITR